MNVTSLGDALNILITSEYTRHHDWMSFASWYSIYKHLPDTEVSVLCARDLKEGYAAYNWPYRSAIKFFQHENVGKRLGHNPLNKLYAVFIALKEEVVKQPLLVIDDDTMCLRQFSKETVDRLNDAGLDYAVGKSVWYFNNQPLERFMEGLNNFRLKQTTDAMLESVMGKPEFIPNLCNECTDPNTAAFTQYSESCGRFTKTEWFQQQLGDPFRHSSKLVTPTMTPSEKKILSLWGQMSGVYEVMK